MIFLAALTSFLALYAFLEIAKRKKHLDPTITRKIAHALSALGVLVFYPHLSEHQFIAATTIFLVLFLISYKKKILTSIHLTTYRTYGEILYPLALIYLAFFFYDTPFIFITTVLVLGIADAAAGFYDRTRNKKTLNGSLVFLVITLVLISTTTTFVDGGNALSLWHIVAVSALVTIVEHISPQGTDNLTVPLSTSLFLALII